MKRNLFLLASIIAIVFVSSVAYAQFGSGIVFDPTQSAHAIKQIAQGSQLYTTTVQTTQNVIAAYNLAQRMASAPQTLYSEYGNLGRQMWTSVTQSANTYGNTQAWINAASSGYGAEDANQVVSLPHIGQISGYSNLSPQGQQAVAAQGATVDLTDAVNATSLQTLGTIRANAAQRETDIENLESSSHSSDPVQQTELATLQRINQALLIQLRTQQETSQMSQTQALQQMVGQKQQQDALKFFMQAADGYESNYVSHTSTDATGLNQAFRY